MISLDAGNSNIPSSHALKESNNTKGAETTADWKKAFGDKSMGEVLNGLSDPNFNPNKKLRGVGDNALDKDAFLKLMLTQLKNQDPTSPLESHEMAAQMAQFTGLEQMMNMNTTLTEMKSAQASDSQHQILGFIGKSVAGDSSKIVRTGESKDHEVSFDLGSDTAKVNIDVYNEAGEKIRSMKHNGMKNGKNAVSWNGETEQGFKAPPGNYSVKVEAFDNQGKKIHAETGFEGMVTGVNYTSTGPVLMVGTKTIRLSDVKKIVDPNLEKVEAQQKNIHQDLSQNIKLEDTKKVASAAPMQPKIVNNLANVGMAQGLINRLGKETGANLPPAEDAATEKGSQKK